LTIAPGTALVAVLGLATVAMIARPVIHAAEDLLQIAVMASIGVVVLGILSTVAVLVIRSRRRAHSPVLMIDYAMSAPVVHNHIHLHGLTDEAVADIVRQGVTALPSTEGR